MIHLSSTLMRPRAAVPSQQRFCRDYVDYTAEVTICPSLDPAYLTGYQVRGSSLCPLKAIHQALDLALYDIAARRREREEDLKLETAS